MTVKCEICGKEFKTTQGLRGHKTFVHHMNNTHNPPTQLATKQQPGISEEKMEQLFYKVKQVNESLSNLITKIDRQDKQIGILKVQVSNAQPEGRKLGREISRYHCDLEQLKINLKRLSRFVQYEFAGIDNDIIWELFLDRPDLKRRKYK